MGHPPVEMIGGFILLDGELDGATGNGHKVYAGCNSVAEGTDTRIEHAAAEVADNNPGLFCCLDYDSIAFGIDYGIVREDIIDSIGLIREQDIVNYSGAGVCTLVGNHAELHRRCTFLYSECCSHLLPAFGLHLPEVYAFH